MASSGLHRFLYVHGTHTHMHKKGRAKGRGMTTEKIYTKAFILASFIMANM